MLCISCLSQLTTFESYTVGSVRHVRRIKADYYESSTWLSPEEKRRIDAREKARRKGLEAGRRPRADVQLSVDMNNK